MQSKHTSTRCQCIECEKAGTETMQIYFNEQDIIIKVCKKHKREIEEADE